MTIRQAVIDFHVHPLVKEISDLDILTEMKLANVELAVLLAMDLDYTTIQEKKFKNKLEKSLEYTHILDVEPILKGMEFLLKMGNTPNSHVADLVRQHKDKFVGFGSVQIGHKSKKYINYKLKEIKNYREELNFRGIKLLPTLQFFNPSESSGLKKVVNFAEKNDMILLVHGGCDPGPWEIPFLSKMGNPLLLEPIIRKTSCKVVIAHTGSYSSRHPGIWFKEALKLIMDYDNVYGDLSAVPYLATQKKFVNEIKRKEILPKIIYGSDFPVTSAGTVTGMQSTIDTINSSTFLDDEEKAKILYSNANSLLFEN